MEEMAVEEIMEKREFSQLETLEVSAVTVGKEGQRVMRGNRIDAQETGKALAAMRKRVEKERTKITLEKEKKKLMKLRKRGERKRSRRKQRRRRKERTRKRKRKKENGGIKRGT